MTFSDTVAQQREKQEKGLKRLITYSLAGSFVLHGGFLLLKVHDFWQPDALEQEEIAIVVTEPSEEESAEVVPLEETSEPLETEFAGSGGSSGAEEPGAATILEAPPVPQTVSNSPVKEEPDEDEPEPELTPVPITEDLEESPEGEVAEDPFAEPSEDAKVTEPRNLSNLLEELRRAREQTRQTATNNDNMNGRSESSSRSNTNNRNGNSSLGEGSRNSVTTVGTGSGLGSGQGSGTGTGSGRGSGTGSGLGSDRGNGTGSGTGSSRGSSSREVSCRGCDFDYPDNADGAEGTAQVIVETDEQGQVVSVTLSQSSGNPKLDQAALEQARERVRLQGARAGESYPLDIDFVQPGSEAAKRAEERGNRRSITVSDPKPVIEPPASTTGANPSPGAEPPISAEPSTTPELLPSPEPSTTSAPTPSPESTISPEPSIAPTSESSPPSSKAEQLDTNSVSEPVVEPTVEPALPPDLPTSPRLSNSPPSESEPGPILDAISEPELAPVPESFPEPEPEPVSTPDPVPPPVPSAP